MLQKTQTNCTSSFVTTKWTRNHYFQVYIKGIGIVNQFTAYPDQSLENIGGDFLLMPLVEGGKEYPDNYPEMRGLFLELVNDGTYRKKGAWRMGGNPAGDSGADYYKIARMWFTRGAARLTDRTAVGLDEKVFPSLWDGEAYTAKKVLDICCFG